MCQLISGAQIHAEKIRVDLQYRILEICFLTDFKSQNSKEKSENNQHNNTNEKDKSITKLEQQLCEWQQEIEELKILKDCLEDCINNELMSKEETDELQIKLKKRVIAMSDPNRFDLE